MVLERLLSIFAVAPGTKFELGPSGVRFAHVSVLRPLLTIKRAGAMAGIVLAMLLIASGARPEIDTSCGQNPPRLDVVNGELTDVFIFGDQPQAQHPDRRTDYPLKPLDTVQIREQAASVEVKQNGLVKQLEGSNVHYLVPPCAAKPELNITQQFFADVLSGPLRNLTENGAGAVKRGGLAHLGRKVASAAQADAVIRIKQATAGEDIEVPVSGQLRVLPILKPDDQKFVKARPGLAYAWLGGQPPYTVTIKDGEKQQTWPKIEAPFIWLEDWQMVTDEAAITVQDATGRQVLGAHLKAAPPAEASEPSVGDSIALFQKGGEIWHLEALRDLRKQAATETLAAQAVAAIRLSDAE